MYECEDHTRGHRSEEARDKCVALAERRAVRKAKAEAEAARRQANADRESVNDYIRRAYCRGGQAPVNVAAFLNREYPKRDAADGKYSWVDIIKVHAAHLNWPQTGALSLYLQRNKHVLLPSEVRKLAGFGAESGLD